MNGKMLMLTPSTIASTAQSLGTFESDCNYVSINSNWRKSSLQKQVHDIDGLVQKRRNSSALAVELRLSCTNPSIYSLKRKVHFITIT